VTIRVRLYIARESIPRYTLKSLEARAPRNAQNPDPLPLEYLDDDAVLSGDQYQNNSVTAHNCKMTQIQRLYHYLANEFCQCKNISFSYTKLLDQEFLMYI